MLSSYTLFYPVNFSTKNIAQNKRNIDDNLSNEAKILFVQPIFVNFFALCCQIILTIY